MAERYGLGLESAVHRRAAAAVHSALTLDAERLFVRRFDLDARKPLLLDPYLLPLQEDAREQHDHEEGQEDVQSDAMVLFALDAAGPVFDLDARAGLVKLCRVRAAPEVARRVRVARSFRLRARNRGKENQRKRKI